MRSHFIVHVTCACLHHWYAEDCPCNVPRKETKKTNEERRYTIVIVYGSIAHEMSYLWLWRIKWSTSVKNNNELGRLNPQLNGVDVNKIKNE